MVANPGMFESSAESQAHLELLGDAAELALQVSAGRRLAIIAAPARDRMKLRLPQHVLQLRQPPRLVLDLRQCKSLLLTPQVL